MTEGTDAIEADSAATRAEVIAAALVDLLLDSEEAVLADLRLEWVDHHQVSVVAVLVDLREVSVDLPAGLAVVSVDLPVDLVAVTAKAGSAR